MGQKSQNFKHDVVQEGNNSSPRFQMDDFSPLREPYIHFTLTKSQTKPMYRMVNMAFKLPFTLNPICFTHLRVSEIILHQEKHN